MEGRLDNRITVISQHKYIYLGVLLILGIQLFLLVNLRFTAWPEMFSYTYLRNNGFLIYKDMIHPYPPLLTMVLGWVYKFFGYHLWVLKVTAWSVALSTSFLVFLVAKQITRRDKPALVSLGVFVFLQPFLEGNMLWFDLAIMPSLLFGLLFLLRRNLFLAGLFLASAVLIKQTTGLYFVFTILYLVFIRKTGFGEVKKIFYGPLLLGIPLVARLIQEGALADFVNWVFIYPLTKWGSITGYVSMEMSVGEVLVILILIAPIILKSRELWKNENLKLVLLFFVCALIAVYPRFSFFHFQTATAILAILYAYLLSKIKLTRLTIVYCLVPIVLIFFLVHKPVLALDWGGEPRFYTQEDVALSKLIGDRVAANESVYLLGLHSGLYVLADRLPPKRWTDNFAWYLEISGVQDEVISRWKNNPPEYIVWSTPKPGNPFDLGTYQPHIIVDWIRSSYTKETEIKSGIWVWKEIPVVGEL